MIIKETLNTRFIIPADLVIITVGFLGPEHSPLLEDLGIEYDSRNSVKTTASYHTNKRKIFSCGDMRCGQSFVVRAVAEVRYAAYHIDTFLKGNPSNFPRL